MIKTSNKTVLFLKSPEGYPILGEHLAFVESTELDQELSENEVLTRNIYVSVDPCRLFSLSIFLFFFFFTNRLFDSLCCCSTLFSISIYIVLRGRMAPMPNGFTVGKPINSLAVGEVVTSRNPKFPVGSIVVGYL